MARFNHSALSGHAAVRGSVNRFRGNVKHPRLRPFTSTARPVNFLGSPVIHLGTGDVVPKPLISYLSPGRGSEALAGGEQALDSCTLNARVIPSSRPGPCRGDYSWYQSYLRETSGSRTGKQTSKERLQAGKGGYAHPTLGPPATPGKKEPRACKGSPGGEGWCPSGLPRLLPRLP